MSLLCSTCHVMLHDDLCWSPRASKSRTNQRSGKAKCHTECRPAHWKTPRRPAHWKTQPLIAAGKAEPAKAVPWPGLYNPWLECMSTCGACLLHVMHYDITSDMMPSCVCTMAVCLSKSMLWRPCSKWYLTSGVSRLASEMRCCASSALQSGMQVLSALTAYTLRLCLPCSGSITLLSAEV